QATSHLEKAVELAPNEPRVHYYAAALLARRGAAIGGDLENARIKARLLKALELDPSYADAWFLLGRAYQVDGKFPYAIDSVLKAIKLAPRNDAYRLALAGIYGEAKQWD